MKKCFFFLFLLVATLQGQNQMSELEEAPVQSWGSEYTNEYSEQTQEEDYRPWSFDQRIDANPTDANPYLVNRNVLSFSPASLLIGSVSLSYERLLSRVLGFHIGLNLHHSNLKADFESVQRNIDNKSYTASIGAQAGLSFYTDKRYAQGFMLAIIFGGGLILGDYQEDPTSQSTVALEDFYGGMIFRLGYRFVWQNFSLTPIFSFGTNIVLYNEGGSVKAPNQIPIYYTLHTANDIFSRHSPLTLFGDQSLIAFLFGGVGLEFSIVF